MENFRRSSHRHNQRNTMAKSVNTNWLNGDYFFGPVSPATKEAQEEVEFFIFSSFLCLFPLYFVLHGDEGNY